MKMNVRNARRLDQEVANVVQNLIDQITPNATVSIFTPLTDESLKDAVTKVQQRVTDAITLSNFRFQLRNAIASANQTEINELTNQLAAKEKYIEIISRLLVQITPDPYSRRHSRATTTPYQPIEKLDVAAINSQLAALVESAKNGGQVAGTLEINTLTPDYQTKVKQDIGRVTREINGLKDRIGAANLNARVEMEVSGIVQQTLLKYGLTAE